MDVLSDVLLAVRLTGAVFFDVEARSPSWPKARGTKAVADQVMTGAEHVISFHIVTEGSCWAEADRRPGPAASSQRRRDRGLPARGPEHHVLDAGYARPAGHCASTIGRPTGSCRSR